jgi:hypothetical protein
MPNCRRLFRQLARRAASLATWTAGSSSAIKTPMTASTTSSSTSVNPRNSCEQTSRRASMDRCATAHCHPLARRASSHAWEQVTGKRRSQRLQRFMLGRLLPTRSVADLALAGLLTPEPSLPSLLVAQATMARESGKALALSYSGGDRPGITPGSLFVGPSSGSGRPPTHISAADYPLLPAACQAGNADP